MTIVYCNDDGSNTSPYDTLAKAATTFLVAVGQLVAGDDLYIGMDHSDAPGADTLYAFPGTIASPNRVISINTTTENYEKANNVQIDLGTGFFRYQQSGNVEFYGVSIKCGELFEIQDNTDARIVRDDCRLECSRNNQGNYRWTDSGNRIVEIWKNTDFIWSNGGSSNQFHLNHGRFIMKGGSIQVTSGTAPASLFGEGSGRRTLVSLRGVDLSTLSGALFTVSGAIRSWIAEVHHCLLHASMALTTGTISLPSTEILMSGCDDTTGNKLYRLEYVDYWGSTVHDDAIYRDSGASDGAANISWKMVSTANAREFSEPTKSPPIVAWVDSIGSKTFTVHINRDNATDLDNDEIWLEIEYLEASADVDSALADDRITNILATPAAQATSTEAWTGTSGFTNENKQRLDVTVTVNRVGPIVARVCLATPSVTVYVDPKVEIA